MRTFFASLFRSTPDRNPWPRMGLCAFASVSPLIIGFINHEVGFAIYGALAGYLLALNDPLAKFSYRILVLFLSFFILAIGFGLGFAIRENIILFSIILVSITYWLGLFSGCGAELERGILFGACAFCISFSVKNMDSSLIKPILSYCLVGFFALLFATVILEQFYKLRAEFTTGLIHAFRESLHLRTHKFIYAVGYTLSVALSVWLCSHFQIERGYWVTITVLLVMRPNRRQSVNTTLQRLLGTAAAVGLCHFLLPFDLPAGVLISIAGASAFMVPAGLKKNYLYASFFVTIFVLMLLELAALQRGGTSNAYFRLRATAIGCGLSMIGSLISEILSRSPFSSAKEKTNAR